MSPITSKPALVDRSAQVLDVLRQMRKEYRARNDTAAAEVISRAIALAVRQLARRRGPARQGAERH